MQPKFSRRERIFSPLLPVAALIVIILTALIGKKVFAQAPSNGTFTVIEYGFGSGGTENSSNSQYSVHGILGETSGNQAGNGTFSAGSGLIFTNLANVPPAPTFDNPSDYYNRLDFIIQQGGNPADTVYAIEIRSEADGYASPKYIQNDLTVGNLLGPEDWQTHSAWGGAAGETVTGLDSGTTYRIRVKARQGDFTESAWSPHAEAATSVLSLSFGISQNTLDFDLNPANDFSDSTQSTVLTTTTNAVSGYVVYGRSTGPLSYETNTIPDFSSPNSSPGPWSGAGFGYNTNDGALSGGVSDRFTVGGGDRWAGFTSSIPGDPVADHTGPVTNQDFTISYRIAAPSTLPSGNYHTTIIYVVVPTF